MTYENIPSSEIDGLNVSQPTGAISRIFQTPIPSAEPAAIAAPSAVVSVINGRTASHEANKIIMKLKRFVTMMFDL